MGHSVHHFAFIMVDEARSPSGDSGASASECTDDSIEAALETEIRPPLPTALRPDGRPAWEPPILDYSDLYR